MKSALVTGANRGIGYEVARQLAQKGFHVFGGADGWAPGYSISENSAQRRYYAACGGIAEVRGQFCLPGLGGD